MPAFFPPPQQRQLPLTPPEYYEHYLQPGNIKPQHFGYPFYDESLLSGAHFIGGHYYQSSLAERRARYEVDMERNRRANYQAQVQREHMYGPIAAPIGAPVLPPMRVQDQSANVSRSYTRQAPTAAPKEEKIAGGVSAHLDYEMDTMVDFVAEMSRTMYGFLEARFDLSNIVLVHQVQPSAAVVEPKFRSYVSSILTSTRLPRATLLLALHYLSERVCLKSAKGESHPRDSRQPYYLLTVAMMLASKFLDDNTFQNRSWAEVSNIPVVELNGREMDWLHDIQWQLHADFDDRNGVKAWFVRWEDYNARKHAPQTDLSLDNLKLETNSRYKGRDFFEPPTPYTPAEQNYSAANLASQPTMTPYWQWPHIRSLSPPSSDPLKSRTPEYYTSAQNTPCYLPSQQQQQQQMSEQYRLPPLSDSEPQGQLVYTRQSPVYGPGYVMETRINGGVAYDIHHFAGYDYTKQYASQLQVGWCEQHRVYDCVPCSNRQMMPMSMRAIMA